jgi:hypothetical protein
LDYFWDVGFHLKFQSDLLLLELRVDYAEDFTEGFNYIEGLFVNREDVLLNLSHVKVVSSLEKHEVGSYFHHLNHLLVLRLAGLQQDVTTVDNSH